MEKIKCFCFASGEIGFSEKIPDGALAIKESCTKWDIDKIQARARLAYDNKTFLVPSIPEAENQDIALDALFNFRKLINT